MDYPKSMLLVLLVLVLMFGCVSRTITTTNFVCWDGAVKNNQSECGLQPEKIVYQEKIVPQETIVYQNVTKYVCWDNLTVADPVSCAVQPPKIDTIEMIVNRYVCSNGSVMNTPAGCVQTWTTQLMNYTEKKVNQTTRLTYWWGDGISTDVTLEKVRFYSPLNEVQRVAAFLKINNGGLVEFNGNLFSNCYLSNGLGTRYSAGKPASWIEVVNGELPYSIGNVPYGVNASGGLVFDSVDSGIDQYTITCPESASSGAYGLPMVFTFSK
jgi:hypothetical protein